MQRTATSDRLRELDGLSVERRRRGRDHDAGEGAVEYRCQRLAGLVRGGIGRAGELDAFPSGQSLAHLDADRAEADEADACAV